MSVLKEMLNVFAHLHTEKTTTTPVQKGPRPTTSPTIARHLQQRAEGRFSTPQQELHVIDRLIDAGNLMPEEREWAYARCKELLRKINEPTTKEHIAGYASRRLDAEEAERSNHYGKMKRVIKDLQKILDI